MNDAGREPMTDRKILIVNADDFGLSEGVNRGIIRAHEHGIVTSASLMVRHPAALPAAAYGRAHPALGLGLHLDLGEWQCRHGTWVALYEVVPRADLMAVERELRRQLEAFRSLVGGDPTHLDSHQHVHVEGGSRPLFEALAREIGVPLRHVSPRVRYCGEFYGQSAEGAPFPALIAVDGLRAVLGRVGPGVTELACHPGEPDGLATGYREERAVETRTLCDPRIRAEIAAQGIELHTFASCPWERLA